MLKIIVANLLIFTISVFNTSSLCAQTITAFKVRKDKNTFVFFQKGISTDTVTKKFGNEFYLIVNDSLKKHFLIQIDNGQFVSTSNDSVVKLNYMKKLKYENYYTSVRHNISNKSNKLNEWKFETLINGVSVLNENKILIKIIDKRNEKVLIENVFYYNE